MVQPGQSEINVQEKHHIWGSFIIYEQYTKRIFKNGKKAPQAGLDMEASIWL